MTTDFRALCAELAQQLDDALDFTVSSETRRYMKALVARARAALALADEPAVPESREPVAVTGQPSDQQLLEVMPQQFHDDLATVSRMAAHGAGPDVGPGLFRVSLNTGVVDFARAVLARWGNPAPQPPAKGEVAELVAWLRETGDTIQPSHLAEHQRYKRAADLLQHLSPPQPVPVSERVPEPSDCAPWPDEPAASAWCWVGSDVDGGWSWEQRSAGCLAAFPDDFTHWLPAHALPLPEVE